MQNQINQILQSQFGFQDFRPGQREAINTLMNEGRLLCIQPTGHGKSLLYQLPAVLLDGVTLVISPLLALMRDQLKQLDTRFHIQAASINTDQSEAENDQARQSVQEGKIKILFIAPEQLDHLDKFQFLQELPITLLVVDEAHCISSWGHDFRPSYRQIIKLARALFQKNPEIKLLALTATANEKTQEDIKTQLSIDSKVVVVHRESMNRPNISLIKFLVKGAAQKLAVLKHYICTSDGPGLIYCATRDNTEKVAEYLNTQGIHAGAYHAGMALEEKRVIQNNFINNDYAVIVATNSLGMGIDKTDLRFVVHYDFPGSITAYYQEVGRCGRDGLAAEGVLLYDPIDKNIQEHFIESAQPSLIDFECVLNAIKNTNEPPNLMMLKRLTGLHPTKLTVVLAELIDQNFAKKISVNRRQLYEVVNQISSPNLSRYEKQYALRKAELLAMQNYAESKNICLMQTLREALGDRESQPCGKCDGCQKRSFFIDDLANAVRETSAWLEKKTIPIKVSKRSSHTISGISILDSTLRSEIFINFMRNRAKDTALEMNINPTLMKNITDALDELLKTTTISCVIPIPSRSWVERNNFANYIADYLNVPVYLNALIWSALPTHRQGELLNNDQRKYNVESLMRAKLDIKLPSGGILLLDDYIGSGATMNEAIRALQKYMDSQPNIVPFTIASIKWRLGKSGMV